MGRHKKGLDINGWLIVDKPRNTGSTDVVNLARRLFKAKKCGHCGTLDPFATGVLPIAFGEATKLIPFVTDGEKEYEFVVQWGEATDTADTEGNVRETSDKIPSREEIEAVIPSFVGEIEQVPPAYSAIKINGRRAYDLVRKGEAVEMPARRIHIYDLKFLEEIAGGKARFRVRCSKGTYVRTLGQDLALALGTVGHLCELRRVRCGIFGLDDKISLESLKNIVYFEDLQKFLLPLETLLRDIAVIAVSEADALKLKMGQSLSPRTFDTESLRGKTAAATCDGSLIAIVRIDERRIAPVRVFNINDKENSDVDYERTETRSN